jgi:hypothetical protein
MQERLIYGPYVNAQGEQVYGDPVRIYRRLWTETEGNLAAYIEQNNQSESGPAAGVLADATVKAFDLMPFDSRTGQGTLEEEALSILKHFLDWRELKKKPQNAMPTSPQSMGSPWTAEEMQQEIVNFAAQNPNSSIAKRFRQHSEDQQVIHAGSRPPMQRRNTASN